MDLVFIVIYETEYSIAFSWNPLLLLAKWSAILIRMDPLFGGTKWSLESLTPPWGDTSSIYEHIRLHGTDPLPDEARLEEKTKLKWTGGAWDGVLGHHWRGTDEPQRVAEILLALRSLLERADGRTLGALYGLVVQESILPSIDPVLKELEESLSSLHRRHLLELGRYLATRAGHREAVKFGIAVVGIVGRSEDLETLTIIGRNEEFTLYVATAIARIAPEPEQALWALAKTVRNWGRIQTVERLKETQNPEIQAWMLREGFRNGVMDEYLACICARAGKLHDALKPQIVDDALLDGAADIIHALIRGGPAEDIDDYAHAVDGCESYVNHVWSCPALGLKHFLTVAALRQFLSEQNGWEKRKDTGWTETRRRNLQSLCEDIFSRQTWREQAMQALNSIDEQIFYEGDSAASCLSIDTWEIHFDRVKAAPLDSSFSWYRLLRQTDESRIDSVLSFAESILPFDRIETGPAEELGMGPGFEPHETLDWVLQHLNRFPKRGWRLIRAGLRSPGVRNRNMAIHALAAWPRESWPSEVTSLVLEAHEREPDKNVKGRLTALLEGKPVV